MYALRRSRWFVPVIFFSFGYFSHYILFGSSVRSSTNAVSDEHKHTQFLVVLILSAIPNYERRQTIRDTWASELSADVKIYFVISAGVMSQEDLVKITTENSKYEDLLMLHGVEDNFHSLTEKVLVALSWLTGDNALLGQAGNVSTLKTFQSFQYVLKCDDDSYVRPNAILTELQTKYKSSMLYWGFFDGRARVKRAGKYKDLIWDNCDTYLPYALGGGYVLAEMPVKFIAKNANNWRLYLNEDTSIGAWLANLNEIDRKHDPRFDTEYLSRGCHQSYLVTHKISPSDMRRLHQNLAANGLLCQKEYRTRLSYKYDWTVQPSKCCQRNNPNIP